MFCISNLFCCFTEIPDLSVENVLKWLTGTKRVPPLAFSKKIQCKFLHGCPAGCRCRPTTSTCDLSITLPVHLDTEENMKEIMISALVDWTIRAYSNPFRKYAVITALSSYGLSSSFGTSVPHCGQKLCVNFTEY